MHHLPNCSDVALFAISPSTLAIQNPNFYTHPPHSPPLIFARRRFITPSSSSSCPSSSDPSPSPSPKISSAPPRSSPSTWTPSRPSSSWPPRSAAPRPSRRRQPFSASSSPHRGWSVPSGSLRGGSAPLRLGCQGGVGSG